jgi:1A family penicillin-binding protein
MNNVYSFIYKLLKKVGIFLREACIIICLVLIFSGLGIGLGILYLYKYEAPDVARLSAEALPQTTVLYDRTGEHILYEIYGEENRKIIPHEEIPDFVRMATLAAEDRQFYEHWGVDPRAVLRALKANLESGDIEEGGSTITMQLVRNLYLTKEKTFERKVTEAIMAIRLEQKYTKDEILDWYLNTVPYGSNAYGIEVASEVFFDKNARDLTLDEAVLLASLPKATTFYSPYGENQSALEERINKISQALLEEGMITVEEYQRLVREDALEKLRPREDLIRAPHFVFYILEKLEEEYGEDLLRVGGLKVYTTLDYEMQEKAEEVVFKGAQKNLSEYSAENSALVAIDPKTGEILAMAGSRDYFDEEIDGEVNVATSLRQPGSAFKPIAYAKALELGLEPHSFVYDVPTSFGPDGSGSEYTPGNYGGNFFGRVTLESALAMSLNIPAVKALYIAGLDNTIELAQRLGITSLTDRNRYGLSLVLGGGEVQLLELTGAFGVFANDGVRNDVHGIRRIENAGGGAMEDILGVSSQRVLEEQVARKMNAMLSNNDARTPIFGPESDLFIPNRQVAAKTGTTQSYRDGWTVGYTPNIAIGVWAGNNDNRAMRPGSAGVFVASPIWNEYMRFALEKFPEKQFQEPLEVAKSDVPMIGGRRSGRSLLYYVNRANFPGAPLYDPKMIARWDGAIQKKEDAKKDEEKDNDD